MRIVGYRGGGKRSATDGSVLLLEKTYAVQCEEMLINESVKRPIPAKPALLLGGEDREG